MKLKIKIGIYMGLLILIVGSGIQINKDIKATRQLKSELEQTIIEYNTFKNDTILPNKAFISDETLNDKQFFIAINDEDINQAKDELASLKKQTTTDINKNMEQYYNNLKAKIDNTAEMNPRWNEEYTNKINDAHNSITTVQEKYLTDKKSDDLISLEYELNNCEQLIDQANLALSYEDRIAEINQYYRQRELRWLT